MVLQRLLQDVLVTYLFEESACRKEFAAFVLALLPLVAEAATTFTVCRGYLRKRPPAAAIPSSIKSILLINLLLTLLLVCAVVTEGVIVSAKHFMELPERYYTYRSVLRRVPAIESVAATPTPTPTSGAAAFMEWAATPTGSVIKAGEGYWSDELKMLQKNERCGVAPLDLLALGLVWMVVVVYVGVVARAGLRVAEGGESEKASWSLRALQKIMRVVDRSKWVGLCIALFFSTWVCFHGPVSARAYMSVWAADWKYSGLPPRRAHDLLAFLLETMYTERVWRWTAASSTLILLALVLLYTIAARVALYISCRRFSLQHADDPELTESPFICATV